MATIAGKVISIKNGNFEVITHGGSPKTLSAGDTIYENDLVYGIGENKSSAKIEIELNNSDVVVLKKGQKQLIDASLLETADGEEELFFAVGDIELIMEAYREMIDVSSGLRKHSFADSDILEEETTKGEEDAKDTEQSSGIFDTRMGDSVDLSSKVINKKINPYENPEVPRTQIYDEGEKNKGIREHGNKELGKTPPNPFEYTSRPSNPNNPSNPNRPTDPDRPTSTPEPNEPVVTPPAPQTPKPNTPSALLRVEDLEIEEFDGEAYVVVKLNRPAEGDIVVDFVFKDNTAKEGEDYTIITKTITIPSGEREVKIPVKIINNDIYEGPEDFKIIITNTQGKVIVEKGEATVTITDKNDEPKVGIPVDDTESSVAITPDTQNEEADPLAHTITLTNKSVFDTVVRVDLKGAKDTQGKANIGEDTTTIFVTVNGKKVELNKGDDGKYSSNDDTVKIVEHNDGSLSLDVTVKSGNDTIVVEVHTIDDSTYEGDETYTISAKSEFGEVKSAIGTIKDMNPAPEIDSIENTDRDGVVNDGIAKEGETIIHTVNLSSKSAVPLKVEITLADGTATVNEDIEEVSVSFDGGTTTTTVTVGTDGKFIVEVPEGLDSFQVWVKTKVDATYELDEQYTIKAKVKDSTIEVSAQGTITEDLPKVSIQKVQDGEEGGQNPEFKISLDKTSTEPITVQLSKIFTGLEAGEDAASNDDFGTGYKYFAMNSDGSKGAEFTSSTGDTITIPAGSKGVYVEVPVKDDTLVENDEYFKLKIDVVDGSKATIGTGEAKASIIDNDSPQIESIKNPNDNSTSDVKVYEGDDLVFKVKITIPSTKEEAFDFSITDGSATGGADTSSTDTDYINIPTFTNGVTYENGKIKVPAGVTEFDVIVKSIINNDDPDESDSEETFKITVGGKESTGIIVEAPSEIKSVDKNGDITAKDASAMEGEYLVHKVVLTGDIGDSQKLVITLSNDTATIGTDTSTARYSVDGGDTWNTVTLIDGKFTLTNTEIGTNKEILVAVQAVMDGIVESDEFYTINASMQSGDDITSSKTAVGKILDYVEATPPKILTITDDTVDEGEEARFKVTLDESSKDELFEFTIGKTGDSAIGGDDYENDPSKLIFTNGVTYDKTTGKITVPAGVTEFEVIVPTIVDEITEPNETFTITVGAKEATGTIKDPTPTDTTKTPIVIKEVGGGKKTGTSDEVEEDREDPSDPNSALNPAKAKEGESLIHTIKLSAVPTEDTELTITFADGIATIGEDTGNVEYSLDGGTTWTALPSTGKIPVTVADNTDTIFVRVPAKTDSEYEGDEVYYITAIMEDNGVTSSKTSTGTIEDIDTPTIIIDDVTVPEGEEAIFKVSVPKSEHPQEYDFKVGDDGDSATKTDDYKEIPTFTNGVTYNKETGKITVPAGVEEFEVIVKTKTDDKIEGDETFTIEVGDKTGTGTITDVTGDDERAALVTKITDASTMEGGINQHTIDISPNRDEDITVKVTLKDDTATISSDIEAVRYSIDDGQTWIDLTSTEFSAKTFDVLLTPDDGNEIIVEVKTLRDNIWEGAETYKITAAINDGTDIVSQQTATGSIVDASPVIDSIKSDTKPEGEALEFVVKLNFETMEDMEFDFNIADGTAKLSHLNSAGNDGFVGDYSAGDSITFTNGVKFAKNEDGSTNYSKIIVPKGVSEFEVKVPTNIDNVIETDETLSIKVGQKEATGTILDNVKIPGLTGGPGNGNDTIDGGSGDDVIVSDFGGVKTTMEPGMNYNMAFILDVSGSMGWNLDNGSSATAANSRLTLLKEGIKQYIEDTVIPFAKGKGTATGGEINLAFITFSATASLKLSIKDLAEGNWSAINSAIDTLSANGNTNWEDSFNKTTTWFKGLDSTDSDGKANGGYENLTFFITDGDPTAKVSSGSNNTLGYLTAAKNAFDKSNEGLGEISKVHAIGVGNMVNKSWLSLFDNTENVGTVIIDTSPTKTTFNLLNSNLTKVKSDGTTENVTPSGGKIALADNTPADGKATLYISQEFTMDKTNSYISFNYYKESWKTGDSFVWYLQKLENGEWLTLEVGGNASANDTSSSSSDKNTGQKTFQTGILDKNGEYRFVFEVADNSSDGGSYKANIGNFQYNTSDTNDILSGNAGQPDVIMTAEQLQYALEAGGLYPDLLPVGNDIVHGGDGNDIIFGDSINTDWLEWAGRNHDAANQPQADGSGMAALKYYLGLEESKQMDGYKYTLVDATKGVQSVDYYNFIKDHASEFSKSEDSRGGDDTLYGDGGADIIFGQGGNDTIYTDLHTEGGKIKGDILLDGGTGKDTLILEKNYDIDFSIFDGGKNASDRIKNIEIIDLTEGNHKLENLTLQDVLNMTDEGHELIIKGDAQDKVAFKNDNGWSKSSTDNIDGATFDIYTNSNDSSVKVKVESTIDQHI